MIGFYNLHARVEHFNHLADFLELIFSDQIFLIDYERRTEFNLLYEKGLDVFLILFVKKLVTAGKLIHKARRIDHTHDVVKLSVPDHLKFLCNRHRLADTGSLNHYVIIFFGLDQVFYILRKLAFQSAADASVCKRNYVACVGDFRSVGNQLGINVNLAYVIDDDGNLISFLIAQNLVQKRRLTSSKISAQKRHRGQTLCHIKSLLIL